jgi:hypothetical protein
MRKFHLFLYGFIFTVLTIAVFVIGCGGTEDSGGDSSCKDGCGTNSCSYYRDQLTSRCHTVSNGIEYVGGLVPGYSCCSCPSGTTEAGADNVSACHPWKTCTCN